MKKLFTAIRRKAIDVIKNILQRKPEVVNCVAKQPPKKDDGQSSLQVAIKSGNSDFTIPYYVIEKGGGYSIYGTGFLQSLDVTGCF